MKPVDPRGESARLDPDDRRELESFVSGVDKHNATKLARRAFSAVAILAEHGIDVHRLDNDGVRSAALAFLTKRKLP